MIIIIIYSGKRYYSQNRRIYQLRIMEDEKVIWDL